MGKGVDTCPICNMVSVSSHRPFCSAACSEVDLGYWFSEIYRISDRESSKMDETSDDNEITMPNIRLGSDETDTYDF